MENTFTNKLINTLGLENYTIIDTEYLCYTQLIYQVGLLRVRDGKQESCLSITINPGRHKSPKDFELNDLTDQELDNAKPINEEIERIVDYIGKDIIVGYNVKTSDIDKLSEAYHDECGKYILNDYVDVMELVKNSNLPFGNPDKTGNQKYGLEDVCNYLGLVEKHHDALCDCITTYKLYEILKFIPSFQEASDLKSKLKQAIAGKKANVYSPYSDRYGFFNAYEVDAKDITQTDLSTWKFAFSNCAPQDEEIVRKMKMCGITSSNLYEKVRRCDHLDLVIIPDINQPTVKAKDAIKWGVQVISYNDFCSFIEDTFNLKCL